MVSALNDPAVLQHDDLICRAHGGQTVGNHQNRFAFCQLPDGLLQFLLVFGIHAGRGFIQNDDGCVLQNCPCNGDSLLFPAGEAVEQLGPLAVRNGQAVGDLIHRHIRVIAAKCLKPLA